MAHREATVDSRVPTVDIEYRTRPYVCGAVGRWDPTTVDRLRLASPVRLRPVHQGPLAVVWASRVPQEWGTGARRGIYWSGLCDGPAPGSWHEAAERRLAAGVQMADDEVILHTDALGMQDVYVRRHGAAVYFSVRIDPLLDIAAGPLHTDWSAWASIAAVTSPLGEATPFQEVRRLAAATAWRARPSGLDKRSFTPSWMAAEPDARVTAADAVDAVAHQVGGGPRRTAITLSGGYDSRMLAVLASRHRRRMVAWTTSNDDGRDRDLQYAPMVAKALGLRHRVLVPGPEAWVEEHTDVRRRVGYQTGHHVWIMPLVRALRARPEQYLDGLAGDVLFKSLFVGADVAEAADPADRRRVQWEALEQKRLQQRHLLAPGVADTFERLSRTAFDEATRAFDGHPAAATLSVLHTRTARAIAPSAQWLLGPEVSVRLPFLHPEVVSVALRVPLATKLGGTFYREMLHAAHPAVAQLPSTNDKRAPGNRGAMRQTSPAALRSMARSILADDVTSRLLAPEMRMALKDPRGLALVGNSATGLRILNWASLLGDWRAAYASRLAGGGPDAG